MATHSDVTHVSGVRITHAHRDLFPSRHITKEDLARYYERVATWMLPYVTGRPLTLVQCFEGADRPCAYMRHSHAWGPRELRRVLIQEKTKRGEYLVAESAAALVALAQMDVLEIHTWNARAESIEKPDRIVFDLDPGPRVAWHCVLDAAHLVRSLLARLDLECFAKVTGGMGLHVVVPIAPRGGWDDSLSFARALAHAMARADPRRFTASMVKSMRAGRVYVDYLRNHRAATSIAEYSTRANPRAPVAVPVSWEELTGTLRSDAFTMTDVLDRVRTPREDPWPGSFTTKQRLRPSMTRSLESAMRV
ncbi:MAG TPA: non-homologous end-joining DNA ligase [Polyangiaceae bacterium]